MGFSLSNEMPVLNFATELILISTTVIREFIQRSTLGYPRFSISLYAKSK